MIGIYCIKCKANNKVYIGSSINIESRLRVHKRMLNSNTHYNTYLQNSWNKYGKDFFKFSVIEICNKENLLEKESFYIEKNNSLHRKKGFNLVTPERNDDLKCNEEYLIKLSLVKKGKTPKNISICRDKQRREILEYEDDVLICEYSSTKEAGIALDVDYKLINNVLRGRVKNIKKYPHKTWKYKDGLPTRYMKKDSNKAHWRKGIFKKVFQYDYNGNLLNIFSSIDEASSVLKIAKLTITNSCSNKNKRCTKLKCIFKYE